MAKLLTPNELDLDVDTILPIVVGAHLRAEQAHRPLGYRLQDQVTQWLHDRGQTGRINPTVCTDLWYLNDQCLLARAAICLGEPGVNAATAYFANRLPTAFVIEESYEILFDPEFIDRHACIWGVNAEATAAGLDRFLERYLDSFLEHALETTDPGDQPT